METTVIPSGTVVVGIDGSPSADRALGWAISQAVRASRQLTLAHGIDPDGLVWLDPTGVDRQSVLETIRGDGRDLVARARARVAEVAPDLPVHELIRMADPRVMLLELSERADLVVLGSRGRGPVSSLLLGSVGVGVSKHAACPVVVVRPGNRAVVRNGVIVGADGSERSLGTVEFAYRQASLQRLPLTILHSYWDTHIEDDARRALAEAISGLAEKFPDVRARTELVRGLPDDALVRASHRMDLVVVGAHHGGRWSTLVNGSVSASVVEHAACPVAVVPAEER
ncbi:MULTISPECIES: universal stress protein [unclassified Nocardioides]|uniref:universal stress protein n=1 Tax=unclassified Nocardioides TaxID=2615069 RepID=UPI0009F0F2B6|nr:MULTISPECIES: universal stress protein [unclassified Nocardioides]GAW47770.1 UspA domain-containing protein [Nocardioides sp. PD653-B2]GAW56184.1 UspA domain-containing protein [Nocardioides sp. PD653]